MASKSKDPATVNDGAGPGFACLAASSSENTPSIVAAQATAPDAFETALRSVTAHALRKRAAAQRQRAEAGTATIDAHECAVKVRSPEAALALRLAAGIESIASEIEAEGVR